MLVSEQEALKRMLEFSKRKAQFLATARTGKLVILAVMFWLVAGIQVSSQSVNSSNNISSKYKTGFMFGGGSITLNPDGSFEHDSGSCTTTTREVGTYSVAEGTIQFKILKYTGKNNDDEKEVDLFDAKSRREFFHYSEDEKDDSPKTEFPLNLVKWGDRTYLISETDLASFTAAINLGVEPGKEELSLTYYGDFFLREGDEEKNAAGKPSLPSKYQYLLLNEPINAMIVSIQAVDNEKESVATIDKGRLNGVKVGMSFISKDQDPDFCCKSAVVLSVQDTSAKIEAYYWLVGQAVTTKLVRKTGDQ